MSEQQSTNSGTSGGNIGPYSVSQNQQSPQPPPQQSSLLLNSVNLAWSQPSGCILVAPKPDPEIIPPQSSLAEGEPISSGISTEINSPYCDSPTSSVSTFNTLSDFEKLSIAESKDSNLESISHRAVAGSTDSLGVQSSDSSVASSSVCQVSQENVPTKTTPQSPTATTTPNYKEVDYHWFYRSCSSQNEIWKPFSNYDSYNLEYGFRSGWIDNPISTNGTRYDVFLRDRIRKPVYWDGQCQKVRRCSWFYKRDSDYRFVPYDEDVAQILESNYRDCFASNTWNRRVDLALHEFVVFYAADSIYHYIAETTDQDGWGAMMETNMRPRYAYRGLWLTNSQIERDECGTIDHVIFMVHGIGNFCDISFRKLVEVVGDFREISADLINNHYAHEPTVGRVEVLPISWHTALHTDQLDSHLNMITLPSIPRMRSFTNDTILDALFYTSPQHSQIILNAVASELNRLYSIFLSRNPGFSGSIALGGHSLGSLILFDLLSHQASHQTDPNIVMYQNEQLYFQPSSFFAFGSPIPVFLTVRGIQHLDINFKLPTCSSFYNIYHPFDPIAYRLEPLINSESSKVRPVLIPHHKGRKRFHLEIRDSIARMGTELKEKVLTSIKGTIDSIYGFVKAHQRTSSDIDEQLISENNQTNEAELFETRQRSQLSGSLSGYSMDILTSDNNNHDLTEAESELVGQINFGQLNSGRRIDYVLQERPIEIVNEYLFAIASHGCYWSSEDTALLVIRELYRSRGFIPKFDESTTQMAPNSTNAATTSSTGESVQTIPPPPESQHHNTMISVQGGTMQMEPTNVPKSDTTLSTSISQV